MMDGWIDLIIYTQTTIYIYTKTGAPCVRHIRRARLPGAGGRRGARPDGGGPHGGAGAGAGGAGDGGWVGA